MSGPREEFQKKYVTLRGRCSGIERLLRSFQRLWPAAVPTSEGSGTEHRNRVLKVYTNALILILKLSWIFLDLERRGHGQALRVEAFSLRSENTGQNFAFAIGCCGLCTVPSISGSGCVWYHGTADKMKTEEEYKRLTPG